jgi:hypothetical protein
VTERPAASPSAAPERVAWCFALVLAAVALGALGSSRAVLFTNDGGQHLYGWVAALHPDDARRFGDYVVAHQSPTARGPREVFTLLEPALGWERAFRATVATTVLLWAAGFTALVLVAAPRRRWLALLGLPLALQGPFFFGFLPFWASCALVFGGWAAFFSSWRHRILGAALLFALAAHAHVVAAAVGGLALALVALGESAPGRRARTLGALFLVGAWPLVVVALSLATGIDPGAAHEEPLPFVERVRVLAETFQPGPAWRNVAGVGLLVGAGIICVLNRRHLSRRDRLLAMVGAAFLLAGAALPTDIRGWGGAGDRLLPLGAVLLFLATPLEALPRAGRFIVVCILILHASASAWWVRGFQAQVLAEHRPLLEALATFEPAPAHFFGLTVAGDDAARATALPARVAPSARVPQLAAIALGGFVDGSHASLPGIHPLKLKPGTTSTTREVFTLGGADEDRHLALVPRVMGLVAPFEGLLFFSAAPEPRLRAAFEQHGLVREREGGGLTAYRLVGCPLAVDVWGPPGADVELTLGLWPEKSPMRRARLQLDAAGAATLEVARVPCGEAWVTPVGVACAEAAPGLPLRAPVREGRIHLSCSLPGR